MKDLNGKFILFFSPRFFDYEREIKSKLEELGATVSWFDDRPSNNFFSKALIRLNRSFIKNRISAYYKAILKQLRLNKTQFDYVFFLNPEAVSVDSLKEFKSQFPDAKFVLYMWDSLENRKNTIEFIPFFDAKFTFDPSDAQKFDLRLRPLFYIDVYKAWQTENFEYDLLFTGTAHSDRYTLVNGIAEGLTGKFRVKLYFFLSSKSLFWAKRLFDKNFKNVKYRSISFIPLTHKFNSELVHKSKVILDINHPKQRGLTMRTIEALGAKKKLITTNADIVNYDFFNRDNILIIDRSNPVVPEAFMEKSFDSPDDELLMKYSIVGWIADIFD